MKHTFLVTAKANLEVSGALVAALLADQHPDLADLPLREVDRGWDNVLFRLGDDLAVRMPHRFQGAALIDHELRWLAELLDGVPDFAAGGLDAASHVREGQPGHGYPWRWAVVPWHRGDVAASTPPVDPWDAAGRLGRFLAAVHRPAPDGVPPNPWRGVPLVDRQPFCGYFLDRIAELGGSLGDGVRRADVEAAFEDLVAVAADSGPPLWLYGDVHTGNLIVRDGVLRAAIDFGDLTRGDRASDLSVAWSLFADRPDAREEFRAVAGERRPVDHATWARARGWAILLNLAYLQGEVVTPERTAVAQRGLAAALADG